MHFAIFREYTEDALSAPSQDFNKNKNMCHNDRSFPISSQRIVAEPLEADIPRSPLLLGLLFSFAFFRARVALRVDVAAELASTVEHYVAAVKVNVQVRA